MSGVAWYGIDIWLGPSSKWAVTNDVLGVGIERTLNLYPGGVEAGTADITLANICGRYSPLVTSYHGGYLRPTAGIDVVGMYAASSGDAVSSFYLFRGMIDSISVQPSLAEQTVTLTALDRWSLLQDRDVSTSLFVGIQVNSLLAAVFDSASIEVSQRTFDTIPDILPYVWFRNRQLSTVVAELIKGGGYAAYVTVDGMIRVRDRYFDVGGTPVGSYHEMYGLSYTFGDEDLVNQVTVKAEPRQPFGSTTVVAAITDAIVLPASAWTTVWLDYQDPRNQEAAPARNLQAMVSSTDWLITANTLTTSSIYNAQSSLRASFFGETAKVQAFNGGGTERYLSRLQVRGEPMIRLPTLSVQYDVESSQSVYGIRSDVLETPLFGTRDLLEQRALDVLELFSAPNPKLSIRLVDDYPRAMSVDLGQVVTVVNSATGLDDQFTILRIGHQISTEGAGWAHSVDMSLQLARQLGGFILDTDHLDNARLAR